jgi:hypothetical protein
MTNNKGFIDAIRYLIMFLLLFTVQHVLHGGAVNSKIIIISIVGATIYAAMDHVAPTCRVDYSNRET